MFKLKVTEAQEEQIQHVGKHTLIEWNGDKYLTLGSHAFKKGTIYALDGRGELFTFSNDTFVRILKKDCTLTVE